MVVVYWFPWLSLPEPVNFVKGNETDVLGSTNNIPSRSFNPISTVGPYDVPIIDNSVVSLWVKLSTFIKNPPAAPYKPDILSPR